MTAAAASSSSLFVTTVLRDRVVLPADRVCKGLEATVLARLKDRFEGICSHHGYIRRGSIALERCSQGQVRVFSLNGDVEFIVHFSAEVCNPCNGTVVEGRVVNTNRFGIMAVVSVDDALTGEKLPVLEAIVVRGGIDGSGPDPRMDAVQVGHVVRIEILGKRYQLNDTKIPVVARLALDDAPGAPDDRADAADDVHAFMKATGDDDEDALALEGSDVDDDASEPGDYDSDDDAGNEVDDADEDEDMFDEDADADGANSEAGSSSEDDDYL